MPLRVSCNAACRFPQAYLTKAVSYNCKLFIALVPCQDRSAKEISAARADGLAAVVVVVAAVLMAML
jgi:hypothetical protein